MIKVCIICANETFDGELIQDTQIIKAIRTLKQKLKMASNNQLAVCPAHFEDFVKRRKSFERKVLFHVGLSVLIVFISVLLPLMTSRPVEPMSVFLVLILALFLSALSLLSYVPPLQNQAFYNQLCSNKNNNAQSVTITSPVSIASSAPSTSSTSTIPSTSSVQSNSTNLSNLSDSKRINSSNLKKTDSSKSINPISSSISKDTKKSSSHKKHFGAKKHTSKRG